MIRLSMVIAVGLGVLLLVSGCGGGGNACDCQPTISLSSPTGSNALTEFDDQDPNTPGIQYGVAIQTTCIKGGQKLVLSNDKNPGGDVEGTVVIDDQASGTGHINFGIQTFLEGTNHVCLTGTVQVNYMSSGTTSCSSKQQTAEVCKDILVSLGVPACRFENPSDGAALVEKDDSNPGLLGFQSDVRVVCKAVNDGAVVTLKVNNSSPLGTTLANSKAVWNNTTLVQGTNLLHVETTGVDLSTVVAEILVTVDTGDCVVRLSSPADGSAFTTSDATITVETDATGSFSCADGSAVTVRINTTIYQGTFYGILTNHKADINVTFYEGNNFAYAEVQGGTGQKSGRSLVSQYSVSLTTPYVLVVDPLDLKKLGVGDDSSLGLGFQYDVKCQFTGAAVGDTVDLYRKVEGTDANMVFVASHQLVSSELSDYTFTKATLLADPATQGTVLVRCVITHAGGASNDNIVSTRIDLVSPDVDITRPTANANLNIYADMCDQNGFQTQVDIRTLNTHQNDTLILCVCHGACFANPSSTDRCQQQGFGAARFNGVVTGVTTALSCIPFDQGDSTLRAFAENAPGQGAYSDPMVIHVDSVPPTVDSISVTSDANHDGCINQAEGSVNISVTVSDSVNSNTLEGRTVNIINGWPTGPSVGSGVVSGGVANISGFTLSNGVYELTATLSDAFGNPNIQSASPIINDPNATFSLTVEAQIPAITITNPLKSILNSSDSIASPPPLDFVFAVSTSGVEDGQLVTFTFGSTQQTSAVSAGAASIPATLPDGSYTLQASVSDACGNAAVPATKSIQVDTTKPTITCSSPGIGAHFSTQNVNFQCHTGDANSALTAIVVSNLGNCQSTVTSNSTGDISFNCLFQNGTANLSVTVTDPAGNVSDPYVITGVNISVSGCAIAFQGLNPVEIYNASNDTDHNPANGLQIDLTAHSSNCNAGNHVFCTVTLNSSDGQVNSSGSLDASGNVTFTGVTLADNTNGVTMTVTSCDSNTDSFLVQLVDLYPPTLTRLVPGGDTVSCVASTGNPNVNDTTILADKIAGAPCDMDLQFQVTNGGDSVHPGSLSIKLGGSDLVAPTAIESTPQTVDYTNTQVPNNATNSLVVTARDYAGNQSTINMTVTTDVIAPSVITATAALDSTPQSSRHADVRLNWNAVGDDGNTGTATAYLLRWSKTAIITEDEWNLATPITANLQSPAASGTAESYLARGLPPLNTYHIALRAVDEVGNESSIADVSFTNMWNSVTYTGNGDTFGYRIKNIGDTNGDGRDELAVSAYDINNSSGALYIFYGSQNLTDWQNGGVAPQVLARNSPGGWFSWDVSSGDLDGDGLKDLVVSEPQYQSGRGRVTIYFNQGAGVFGCGTTNDYCVEIRGIASPSSGLGFSVDVIGNINKSNINPIDNYDDLFISAPAAGSGRGYIFLGRSRQDWQNDATADDGDGNKYIPLTATNVIQIVGENTDDWFGYRWGATTLGDLNSDGKSDFALVASGVNKVYTFDGASISAMSRQVNAGTDSVDVISYVLNIPNSKRAGFGHRTLGGVDFTGDGLLDLIVSDAYSNAIYLLPGMDNSPNLPSVKINPIYLKQILFTEGINFGWDLAAGDINMDGYYDFVAGSNDNAGNRAFICLNTGSSPFFGNSPDTTLSGSGYFGISVVIGDFNGDGLPDIVVGAPLGNDQSGNGQFIVYY